MPRATDFLSGLNPSAVKLSGALSVLAIAAADWLSGNQLSASGIYAIPIAFVTWRTGWRYGVLLALLSIALWAVPEFYFRASVLSVAINSVVKLVGYAVFIALLAALLRLQETLETRVRERTDALVRQVTERERLERELLAVSEREQRRIGQDLHDSLCQHLTGTALAAQALKEKLAARDLPEAHTAQQLFDLVTDAIFQARSLAKGLNPVEMYRDGLMEALEEFAATTSGLFRVSCTFECDYPIVIADAAAAAQLYRIAQEAVGNAIKHGAATRIVIVLDLHEDGAVLMVRDNGSGIRDSIRARDGMGLRIMSHRARVIGATLDIQRNPSGGTTVTCAFPPHPRMEEVGHA